MKGKQVFVQKISSSDWQTVYSKQNAQEAFTNMHNIIQSSYKEAFPLVKKITRKSRHMTWLTESLVKSIRKKNKLYMRYRQMPTVYNKNKYTVYKRTLRSLLKAAEKQHYDDKFLQYRNNLKSSWKILKQLIGIQCKLTNSEFVIDGNIETSSEKIAIAFNRLNRH